jgi:quinol monooxygenase YgiN
MVAVIVRHRVKDYDTWKPFFDEHADVRRRHGAVGHELYRLNDPNEIIIVNHFNDAAAAQAFMADPSLPEVMQRAGVEGAPDVALGEQAEAVEYPLAVV